MLRPIFTRVSHGAPVAAARRSISTTAVAHLPPRPAYQPRTYNKPAATAAAFTSPASAAAPAPSPAPAPAAPSPAPAAAEPAAEEPVLPELEGEDWSRSYAGLSSKRFSKEAADVLMAPIDPEDIECKPDGLIYLPEIKYRRILNRAFGPGGWGLAPRTNVQIDKNVVSREYALICEGRLVSIARGEQDYFDASGIPTATEAAKSNALLRCCKDLGVASELWDPRFIRKWKAKYAVEVWCEDRTGKKKKAWRRKDDPKLTYPLKET